MVQQNGSRDIAAPDARHGLRNIRYTEGPRDQQIVSFRSENTWPHARPFSTLVAAMGAHWNPGCWQRILDMIHYTNQQGFFCALEEIMDRCFQPYDALGAMRNEALMKASQGFEYLLYVDNDVMPTPDMLLRLIACDKAIVAPYVMEPEIGRPLHGPARQRNTGVQPIRWCVLSMLLFKTSVFNATGPQFWDSAIGADEGYHFQKLWHVGHRPYLDTDQDLPVFKRPTYPLATNRMSEGESKSFWDKRRDWLLEAPDRAPTDPNDIHQENGEYLPWREVGTPYPYKVLTAGTRRG